MGDPLYLTDLLDRGLLEEAAQEAKLDLGEVSIKLMMIISMTMMMIKITLMVIFFTKIRLWLKKEARLDLGEVFPLSSSAS